MSAVNLLDLLNNLKPDKMNVDTKLAEQYLEENKAGFHGNVSSGDNETVIDSCGNILYNAGPHYSFNDTVLTEQMSEIPENMKKLAVEIERNTDLFCQLEFLIRKISYSETKHSIKLIKQNLLFVSGNSEKCNMENSIIITDETPLFILGWVVQMFLLQTMPLIIASKEVGVICYLFHKICLKVGFKTKILFANDIQEIKDSKPYKVYPHLFDGVLPEITGVVTEKSDLDSAVDVFLNSDHHPFPVTQIFVQENVYEDFKAAMAWKCKLNQDIATKGMEEIKLKCSKAFEYKNKLFILDFAGNLDQKGQNKQIVFVEAYRTVAEVLSLINKSRRRLCLSLWSEGISEANQIALSVKVPLVWINDCCNFNGPSEISQGIYKRLKDLMEIEDTFSAWFSNLSLKQLTEKRELWQNKTFTERCEIVLEGIGKVDIDNALEIKRKMVHWKINNFISNEKNILVQGFNEPEGVCGFYFPTLPPTLLPCIDKIIKALINGNAVVARKSDDSNINTSLKSLIAIKEIPILLSSDDQDGEDKESEITLNHDNWFNQTKVIWTNFGTTFAN